MCAGHLWDRRGTSAGQKLDGHGTGCRLGMGSAQVRIWDKLQGGSRTVKRERELHVTVVGWMLDWQGTVGNFLNFPFSLSPFISSFCAHFVCLNIIVPAT